MSANASPWNGGPLFVAACTRQIPPGGQTLYGKIRFKESPLINHTHADTVPAVPEPPGKSPSDVTDSIWGWVKDLIGRRIVLKCGKGSETGAKLTCQA